MRLQYWFRIQQWLLYRKPDQPQQLPGKPILEWNFMWLQQRLQLNWWCLRYNPNLPATNDLEWKWLWLPHWFDFDWQYLPINPDLSRSGVLEWIHLHLQHWFHTQR